MARFTAFFDANVLYPAELRNLLMHLALAGIFRATWSNAVHHEWIESLLRNRPDLNRQQLNRTRKLMDEATLDSLVTGYEHLIPALKLPDENDRHVLAAAIHTKAKVIVTPKSTEEFLKLLEAQGLPRSVAALRHLLV